MVQHNYLEHTGSDGSEPQERADNAGYHMPPNTRWIVVEVISAISPDPPGPVNWWLGDAQHDKVLMNPRWREIGADYARGGEYGNYWTVLFGCRSGVLPTVTLDGVTYTQREECGDPHLTLLGRRRRQSRQGRLRKRSQPRDPPQCQTCHRRRATCSLRR
jgi:hypothetical protein